MPRIGEATNSKELVIALETTRKRREELRRGRETLWWNNIAMIAGDHYASWDPVLSDFVQDVPEDMDEKKARLVLNHSKVVARTELSKLTKTKPITSVMANSDEAEDLSAAKVGEAVLAAVEWKFKLRSLRKSALWWMIATGVAAVYTGYDFDDENSGKLKYYLDPNTNEPIFNPDRIRQLQDQAERGEVSPLVEEEYPLGDLEFKVYSPFQLLPDELALDFDEAKDLITTDIVDLDVARGLWPGKASRKLTAEATQLGTMEKRLLTMFNLAMSTDSQVDTGLKVHTFWLKPNVYKANSYLRNGKMLRWAQGQNVLEESEEGLPFDDNRLPFVFFKHVPNATSIWPDSTITDIRGANLELDKTVSQLIENKDFMANPMWLVATQHRIKGKVKNIAGAIIRYMHVPNVPPPQPVAGMQMPAQVENLVVGLRDQILDISGQSEVARGRMPSGVRSGVQVAYLQEEDDTKIAPTVENMEDAIATMGSMILCRCSQFYTTERLVRFYRADGMFDVIRFKGADLKNNTDVIAVTGSAMPKSKAARQQYVLELVSLGILQDPKQIREMLDLGYGEPTDEDKAIAQANRENSLMTRGVIMGQVAVDTADMDEEQAQQKMATAVPVKIWHNHEIHLKRHYSMMMDEEFDRLVVSNPEIVRLFDEHTGMHEKIMADQQQAQLAAMEAIKGSPGGLPAGDGAQPPGAPPPGSANTTMSDMGVPSPMGGFDINARRTTQR